MSDGTSAHDRQFAAASLAGHAAYFHGLHVRNDGFAVSMKPCGFAETYVSRPSHKRAQPAPTCRVGT